MIDPQIAPYLPSEVWVSLRTVSKHIDALPLTEFDQAAMHRGLPTLREKLILVSKVHHLSYLTGDADNGED
jgi:hypothetical protein